MPHSSSAKFSLHFSDNFLLIMKSVVATTLISSVAASCTGTADPVVSGRQCYTATAGALGVTEKVDVSLIDLDSGVGHFDIAGAGVEGFTCVGKEFSKSGQSITTDLSDCVPSTVGINEIDYCSDQDTIKVTVKVDGLFLPITTSATRVDCAANDAGETKECGISCGETDECGIDCQSPREAAADCTGTEDPVISGPQCYTATAGALGVTETVQVTLNDLDSGAGHFDIAGSGVEGFTCAGKEFSKSGQAITTDLSDCVPSTVAINEINYCSDQDSIKVKVKVTGVFLAITTTATRVDCATATVV